LILVTVGTHSQSFNRLIKTVDELVGKNKIRDNVIIQIGYSDYIPKNCQWFKFINLNKFEKLIKKSSLIVAHAGVGSIMSALKYNKPTIVIPRLKKFNEHRDNHQLQITKQLEKQKRIIAVYNIDDLENAIKKAIKWKSRKTKRKTKILEIIDKKLKKWGY